MNYCEVLSKWILCLTLCFLFSVCRTHGGNLAGIYEIIDGTEFVYQVPPVKPKGVLFVAHGCSHSSTDWWPSSDTCVKCTGLPVEKSIVEEALRRNLMVIAISSQNRHHKCWTSADVGTVSNIINHLYKTKLRADYSTPLYLLGASSGGSFVGVLPKSKLIEPTVAAVCVQISAVRDALDTPTLFVLMSRDEHTLRLVQERAAQGYYASHKTLICEPKAVTPGYFLNHGAVRSARDSEIIQRALLDNGFLVVNSMLLREDPRISNWRQVLAAGVYKHEEFGPADSLVPDSSPISEVLNMAWAGHEITDEYLQETFDWFEASAAAKHSI